MLNIIRKADKIPISFRLVSEMNGGTSTPSVRGFFRPVHGNRDVIVASILHAEALWDHAELHEIPRLKMPHMDI